MKSWRQWRKRHRMSQSEFAAVIGLSLRMVKYIEAGKFPPGRRSRVAFASVVERYREAAKIRIVKGNW